MLMRMVYYNFYDYTKAHQRTHAKWVNCLYVDYISETPLKTKQIRRPNPQVVPVRHETMVKQRHVCGAQGLSLPLWPPHGYGVRTEAISPSAQRPSQGWSAPVLPTNAFLCPTRATAEKASVYTRFLHVPEGPMPHLPLCRPHLGANTLTGH
jgi:hypothetical protein